MPLKISSLNRLKHRRLLKLINDFNRVPEQDAIQRLFFLQKINYYTNSMPIGNEEYEWLTDRDSQSWRANLEAFGINPDGSFLFKGIEFARAVARNAPIEKQPSIESNEKDLYKLLQERDALLKDSRSFKASEKQYLNLCCKLVFLADHDSGLKTQLEEHAQILDLAKEKIRAIKGESELVSSNYRTEPLGDKHVNNYNFKFQMKGWEETLVFRVEDRNYLSFEQELHSYPVVKYFADDFALFMWKFLTEDKKKIEFKPVVLSQFARQGSLLDVAKRFKTQPLQKEELKKQLAIATAAKYYFTQVNEFCLKLKEANAYHPDIKLENFLIDYNRLLVSDRKTFVRSPQPLAQELRCSPRYAPPEFLECINEDYSDHLPKASSTHIQIEPLMSYQIGMALKEFLILTQLDEIPDNFEELTCTARSHFQNPCPSIINLSILVEELTRPEANKRLSIEQFQKLLRYITHPSQFNNCLEEMLSAETLGISNELKIIGELLENQDHTEADFLEQANEIFVAISERKPGEPRLNRIAEQLAIKCYTNYSEKFFSQISQEIETALLNKDWNLSPWWRQAVHLLSFGYFRVERITTAEEIDIELDYDDPTFRTHFIQFEFLPSEELNSLGRTEATNLKAYFIEHLDDIRAYNSAEENEIEEEKKEPPETDEVPEETAQPKEKENQKSTKESEISSQPPEDDEEIINPSGTMVINKKPKKKTEAEPAKTSDTHVPAPMSIPPVEEEKHHPEHAEKPQHKKRPSTHLTEHHRFFAATEEANESEPMLKRRSIRRVGSTLFRGERKSHHPRVQQIFAHCPEQPTEDFSLTMN
ncbi:LegK7 family Dot/Icm T4SS effector kinase [Fluoribacter dumoffii]|uniref:LegK7 family Dot/Icm T4SS effector kinase n=1 Tax=Fluoribacter dumoffii TaxID=463 RepID=UPI002243FAD4|nr:LegK7 family Dot/Icm T4SS effector kinase [Fluoribacter dumoffii]MCW8419012.1 hypothetical protein [Fluoribacter dumoffii]